MKQRYIRDMKIGIIGGLIGFFLLYLPIWKMYNLLMEMWQRQPDSRISVYVEGID